ncbi:MAG: hypothetical protein JNM90_20710 [Burkholderiales bacterium]|nr:hypothetical protein [Burkholderiales bacterium]
MIRIAAAMAAVAGIVAGGCGEQAQQLGQATTYKQGKYQGKPDARPYDNAPNVYAHGAQWTAGDKTSWEAAIRRRQQGQNEYLKAE